MTTTKTDAGPESGGLDGLPAILRRLLVGRRRYLVLLFFVMLAAAVAEGMGFALVMPLLGGILGQEVLPGALGEAVASLAELMPESYRLEGVLVLLGLAFLLRSMLLILAGGMTAHLSMRLRADWAERLFRHYLTARYLFLTGQKQGEVSHNVANESFRAGRSITILLDFLAKLTLAAVLFAVLLVAQWQAALAVSAGGVAIYYLVRKASFRYALDFGKTRQALYHRITATAAEAMATVRQIKLYGIEQRSAAGLRQKLDRHAEVETWFSIFSDLPNNLLDFVLVVFVGAVLVALTRLYSVDLAQGLPLMATFAVLLYRLFTTVSFVIARRMKLAATLPSLSLIDRLLDDAPEREALDRGKPLPPLTQEIALRQVCFAYPGGPPVLENFDMTLPRGRTVALVGPSGAGKSTVADLLIGLIEPTGGAILFDGREADGFSLQSRRAAIGYVSQEAELFDTTIRENIRMGRPDADDAAIEAAARLAHVDGFVRQLSDGYETEVGERGVKLSGGQRQRIAIARAVIRQPAIYIFDEATSALDSESEGLIRDAIAKLSGTATVLIIAHRPSTIEAADVIYRLTGDGRAEQVEAPDPAIAGRHSA